MKNIRKKTAVLLGLMIFAISFYGCDKNNNPSEPETVTGSDAEALEQLIAQDESLDSFEPNYNEEDVMDIIGGMGKINTEIFPVRIGQRMMLVNKNLNVEFEGDSAFGTLTRVFEGYLLIAASYEPFDTVDPSTVDTVIAKPFSTTITQNIIFKKVSNTNRPMLDWRIWQVSLAEGGTSQSNVEITKMTIFLPDAETIEIDSPNDYFLSRQPGLHGQIPVLSVGETVTIRIELKSAYSSADFAAVTFGAFRNALHRRAKAKFEMVSENFDGQFYNRVFEAEFTVIHPGFKHAIVNVMPYQTIKDDGAFVEENSWAIPYIVR